MPRRWTEMLDVGADTISVKEEISEPTAVRLSSLLMRHLTDATTT
jgi:hypothetical protein